MVSCLFVGTESSVKERAKIVIYSHVFIPPITNERKIMKKIMFINFLIVNNT
jgi:hypothetical protein